MDSIVKIPSPKTIMREPQRVVSTKGRVLLLWLIERYYLRNPKLNIELCFQMHVIYPSEDCLINMLGHTYSKCVKYYYGFISIVTFTLSRMRT